jgi:hypothetical protein
MLQRLKPRESHDLLSSASDEDVLTKESSTEELLFEGTTSSRGLDSEGLECRNAV